MAGWIKMRVSLARDPRVIAMAEWLMEQPSFCRAMNIVPDPVTRDVTRNVTVALCVTGLLVTWGTAREQGHREGDDLVMDHCRLSTISALVGYPDFGHAMAHIGWAVERDSFFTIFPKFFREQESPEERHRSKGAERQARFRQKSRDDGDVTRDVTRNVTSNVTVTPREEKRREEERLGIAFAQFWVSYPRKEKKVAAEKAFAKINPDDALLSRMLSALSLAKQTEQWRKDDGAFVPHASSWLNGRRWEDEVPRSASVEEARVWQ